MVPAGYDPTDDALYRGGYADVWKGEYRGREVAVKVIRLYWKGSQRGSLVLLIPPRPMLTGLRRNFVRRP